VSPRRASPEEYDSEDLGLFSPPKAGAEAKPTYGGVPIVPLPPGSPLARYGLIGISAPASKPTESAKAARDAAIEQDAPLDAMARRTDPETSRQAAEDVLGHAANHRRLVLEEHRRCPEGLTDFELAERLGLQQTSVGKRRGELRDAGFLQDSGTRRPAPSGSLAIVWQIIGKGD
jgi:hypothetical protein